MVQSQEVSDQGLCSPERVRTAVSGLRGRRPRPLDDGTRLGPRYLSPCSGGRTRTLNNRARTCRVTYYTTPERASPRCCGVGKKDNRAPCQCEVGTGTASWGLITVRRPPSNVSRRSSASLMAPASRGTVAVTTSDKSMTPVPTISINSSMSEAR